VVSREYEDEAKMNIITPTIFWLFDTDIWHGSTYFKLRFYLSQFVLAIAFSMYRLVEYMEKSAVCVFPNSRQYWIHEDLLDDACWTERMFVEIKQGKRVQDGASRDSTETAVMSSKLLLSLLFFEVI
jgi:hypothetical protein